MPPKSTNKTSVGRANATVRPVQAQSVRPAAVTPRATRAPQQFRGTAVGTGSRVPESAIRADESLGRTSQERSFNQHYGVIAPVSAKDVNVSQLQGNKNQNISYVSGAHRGTDFAVPVGTGVRSVKEGGVVKFSGPAGAYGNQVIIEYPDGSEAVFSHLDSSDIEPGQSIAKGETFAKSGNTGRTTGAHLDLEARKDDVASAPGKIWNQESITGGSAFDSSWKGSESGVNNFSANVGGSPSGGGTITASGSESSGSRFGSFSSGTSMASAGYGGIGQQVNLAALNQLPMRRTRISSTSPISSSSVGYIPPQTTNPGTVTSIRES